MRVQCHSSEDQENSLRACFRFDRVEIHLDYSLIGVVVRLGDWPTHGVSGSPSLPERIVRIALPPNTRLTDCRADSAETFSLSDQALPVAPRQPLRAGAIQGEPTVYRCPEEERLPHPWKPIAGQGQENEVASVEPFPVQPFIAADPDLYAAATRLPVATLLGTGDEGPIPVATICLRPVHLTSEGRLEFNPTIAVTLQYEPADSRGNAASPPAGAFSFAQAQRQVALTRRTVVNPAAVIDFSRDFPPFVFGADYLIITDNQRWNAATMAAAGPAGGDLVASFGRLAAWKRQRGLRTRVVTISDIVADRYGNFRTGSRDLQEVIRQFLKMAQSDWGVAWVLLGGDTEIVPIRRVATDALGGVSRQGVNPPPDNTSCWAGDHLRIHAVDLGVWWQAATTNLLVRLDNGLLIPYDGAGTSSATARGWYFTADDGYAMRSASPTPFVRVNGPPGEVDADLQFLYEWNTIPTDLYYSSLVGSQYNQPGRHDWDLLDNGVYGQHGGSNLDGVHFTPAVSLGRASVQTAAQADAFVDKVIAYEKFQRPDGTPLDTDWPRRIVLVSENWGGRLWLSHTLTDPPPENTYFHPAGQGHSLIRLKDTPDWNWSLLAYLAEEDVRLIPYRLDAATAGRGWYFARSEADLSANYLPVPLPSGHIFWLPLTSPWIVVYGPPDELEPVGYILNHAGLDGSLDDQETLREQFQREMPGFHTIRRLYEDIQDMTPAQVAAAPLDLITSAALRSALDTGPHIVSLSGHGNSNGCCKLGRAMADGLNNGYHSFIAYADSCLTNQLDGDAVSEHLTGNPLGGAVAYVGNTRFSWIGVGDDYQRRFFREWATLGGNAHLGLLCDTRATLFGSSNWWDRWAILALNLTGDPEMPLWWREPFRIRVPDLVLTDPLKVRIPLPDPPDPIIDLPYRENWEKTTVHLRQGEQEQVMMAGPDGQAEMALSNFRSGRATLTIARPGHQPLVQDVHLNKTGEPAAGEGEAHRGLVIVLMILFLLAIVWALL